MDYRLTLTGLLSVALLGACVSNGQRIDRQAHAGGLARTMVSGLEYRHVVYDNGISAPAAPWSSRLVVFLDGDGRPWSPDGQRPAADPTTRNPIALQLLMRTPVHGIYISRPCYQEIVDEKCATATWTSGRYAAAVVDSIATVIGNVAHQAGAREIVLIGYSGGGTLAVLVAERTRNVAAVITLAANLDTDAWTRHHRYLPLDGSLNPAMSERPHPWLELHLQAERDTVVPTVTTANYFSRYPNARQWLLDDYDHVCCWAAEWPALFWRIQQEMN